MAKKIVIVGAVAGGMSAATRLRRLDETLEITVFEQGGYTSFANCGLPYALGNVITNDAALVLNNPEGFKSRFNIDVRLNTEVTGIDAQGHSVDVRTVGADDTRQVKYDKLILSQGAEAFRPPIDGANKDHVFTLQTISDLQDIRAVISEREVKQACVIGAGFIGIEAAENLRKLGLEVSLVEYSPHILPPIDGDMAEVLQKELKNKGVDLFVNARLKAIETSSVALADGTEIPASLVIMAAGVRARTTLAKQAGLEMGRTGVKVNARMQTSDPDIYAVGDMVETEHRILKGPVMLALAGPANRQGRLAADHIFGKQVSYRGNVGTAICQVFDLTIGFVGLSVEALRRKGDDPEWVTVHPQDHAGYYPNAHPVTLKLVFEKGTGCILGAQAVGMSGVDKRIDVVATAMQAGMTVFDLEHLELAYAPPYGSAKDPVNMAGFVASNVIRGDVQILHAEDLDAKTLDALQLVDVRSPQEFARGSLPGAVNLPVNDLRGQMCELDKSARVLVYCQVGYRGYLAARILKQLGFQVANLDGGFKAVVDGGFRVGQTE